MQMFLKINGLRNFAIFTGKHLSWSLATLLKRHRCFFKNTAKFFQFLFTETSENCFFQFYKVTVPQWATAHLLFLVKKIMWDSFYYDGLQICSEYFICTLLVETIPTRLKTKTCPK